MKYFFTAIFFSFLVSSALAQTTATKTTLPDPNKKIQVAELSCGKCKLGLQGKTYSLALRIEDKAYYVDGADIGSFGDAHANDGFCNAIRKAEVQEEVVDKRFKITYIKLLPENN